MSDALDALPQYARFYTSGLLEAIINDPIVTSLFIGAFAKDRSVRRFFLGYAACRTINSVANAIGTSGQLLAQAHLHVNQ